MISDISLRICWNFSSNLLLPQGSSRVKNERRCLLYVRSQRSIRATVIRGSKMPQVGRGPWSKWCFPLDQSLTLSRRVLAAKDSEKKMLELQVLLRFFSSLKSTMRSCSNSSNVWSKSSLGSLKIIGMIAEMLVVVVAAVAMVDLTSVELWELEGVCMSAVRRELYEYW